MKISERLDQIRKPLSKVYEEAIRGKPACTRGPQPMMDDAGFPVARNCWRNAGLQR